ncbi:MAG: Gfo/Idh/MocA family oxidoreductase [Deltaproteobacteria bacterium]|nr:Gfo/Idh/MocA family oxidoreductase [Deltaproteobacteria bacterium]
MPIVRSGEKVKVVVVGLGFGAEFLPIYQAHPHAELIGICQRRVEPMRQLAERYQIPKTYESLGQVLADPEVDAVHINTPIPDHGPATIAALRAGKHVACTVPMATSVQDCETIVKLCRTTGLQYMMMETVVYAREFLHVKSLLDDGTLGRLQFVQASHQQDMDGWPGYWEGLPPLHYATHCVGPCLALIGGRAKHVSGLGSGRIDDAAAQKYGSPFAVESCHIEVANSDVGARIYRSLFSTARQYRESFDVYGSLASFEWPLLANESPVLHHKGRPEPAIPERITVPDFARLLPEALRPFTRHGVYDASSNQHLSFLQGDGHGGSHPHLVHAFVSALRGERPPFPDAQTSANWTCVGLLGHASALAGGQVMSLPEFCV